MRPALAAIFTGSSRYMLGYSCPARFAFANGVHSFSECLIFFWCPAIASAPDQHVGKRGWLCCGEGEGVRIRALVIDRAQKMIEKSRVKIDSAAYCGESDSTGPY